jgi:hypothetical protein
MADNSVDPRPAGNLAKQRKQLKTMLIHASKKQAADLQHGKS